MEVIRVISSSQPVRVKIINPIKWYKDKKIRRNNLRAWFDGLVNKRLFE